MPFGFSRAAVTGSVLLATSAVLAVSGASVPAIVAPLALFLACIAIAPAFSRLEFFLPAISRGDRSRPEVAITFDDGPDPRTLPALLDLLSEFQAPATFFVVGAQVKANPHLVTQLLERGHEVGNHSLTHDPMLMLRSMGRLRHEVQGCQDQLIALGARPTVFRPPVGITNSRLPLILRELALTCVTFNNRPLDFGNLRIRNLAQRVLRKVGPGDVILLHDRWPHEGPFDEWLSELRLIFSGLSERGLRVAPLSRVINQPIMERVAPAPVVKPLMQASTPGLFSKALDLAISVAQAFGVVAYPLTTYFGIESFGVRVAALLMLGLHLPGVIRTLARNGRQALGLLGMGAVVVTLCVLAAVLEDTRFMLAYPSLVNLALLIQFGWSLVRGPPMVERFARLQTSSLGPLELAYTRSVTVVWCAFFVFNGGLITALAVLGPRSWWAAYASGISYLLVGLLFTVEFVVRRVRFGKFGTGLPDRLLKVVLPRAVLARASRNDSV